MKILSLPILLSTLFFTSCTTTKLLTSSVKPTDIKDLKKFETLSKIGLIKKGNEAPHNNSLTIASKEVFSEALNSFENDIPLTGNIYIDELSVQKKMNREIEFLCMRADLRMSIINLELTPTLDSLLEVNQQRFGLITYVTGFTRTKENYADQMAKGVGQGILTGGSFYSLPLKSQSTVYAMIIDSKNNNIAFFRKSFLNDKDPLILTVLKKQIHDIFSGYFWKESLLSRSNIGIFKSKTN